MALLFNGKFEVGDYWIDRNHWSAVSWGAPAYNACIVSPSGLEVVPALAGKTGYVGLFTVNNGDICNSAIGDERSMVANPRIDDPEGSERWYSTSVFIPDSFSLPGNTWNLVWQQKDTNDLYVNVALYISSTSGTRYWSIRYGYPAQYVNFPISMSTYGWNDWIVHVKWSSSNSGAVEFYRNGILIHSKSGIRMTSDNPIHYGSIGLYRNPQTITNHLYMTGMKIGLTRADVEYGGPAECPALTCNITFPGE